MSYTKITNFAIKDTYLTGNPAKIIKGAEIDVEFDNIANASALAVEGPAVAIDNGIPRFDGTTGKLLKAGLSYQSSATDNTIGALLVNGAWGFGGGAEIPASGASFDCDNLINTGLYSISPSTLNGVGLGGTLFVGTRGIGAYTQLLITADGLFVRAFTGTWQPWRTCFSNNRVNEVTSDTGSIGYGTGSGGTVTQITSKATTVTLNKPVGQITMNAAALAANTTVNFILNNTLISTTDMVLVSVNWGTNPGAYQAWVASTGTGGCTISVRNITAGSLSDAVLLNFQIHKGANA